MKKIFGLALCLALAAGTARAQQYNDGFADQAKPVLTETELTDVVLFTNGRAEKGIVLEVTAGQPVRIIQADGVVHAYSPLLVDRIVRGCGVEILHTAAPALPSAAASAPVESYDDKPDYYEEQPAVCAAHRCVAPRRLWHKPSPPCAPPPAVRCAVCSPPCRVAPRLSPLPACVPPAMPREPKCAPVQRAPLRPELPACLVLVEPSAAKLPATCATARASAPLIQRLACVFLGV